MGDRALQMLRGAEVAIVDAAGRADVEISDLRDEHDLIIP
jgi:hypothetical protein